MRLVCSQHKLVVNICAVSPHYLALASSGQRADQGSTASSYARLRHVAKLRRTKGAIRFVPEPAHTSK